VLPAAQAGTDVRMRIFTPGEELPMAGHPTIGSTFALARSGAIEAGRDRFVFGLGIGPVPVALTWRGADLSFAWMTQPNPTFAEPIAKPSAAAAVLGLSDLAVAGTGLPVQVVSCGVPFLLVPLTTRAAVDSASLQRDQFDRFREETKTQAHGVFLFSTQPGKDKATVYSRMFAPDLGVGEDPATGSASGPLGCYLVRHNVVPPEKAGAMLSLQGAKMGRPSHVHIAIEGTGEAITSVRVGGEAVLAGEGTLYVV
jgi:trans-2,3-dihydro-3-hydroxyanthranilate isomerase